VARVCIHSLITYSTSLINSLKNTPTFVVVVVVVVVLLVSDESLFGDSEEGDLDIYIHMPF